MAELLDLYKSNPAWYNTDKETSHCYISQVYDDLFRKYKRESMVLEIGIQEGHSIKLWSDYFKDSVIHGVEIDKNKIEIPLEGHNYKIFIEDAYNRDFFNSISEKFDIIIDDGPHSVESQKFALENYYHLLNDDGVLIIEDIAGIESAYYLSNYAKNYTIYDLRSVKKRPDDIIMVCKAIST